MAFNRNTEEIIQYKDLIEEDESEISVRKSSSSVLGNIRKIYARRQEWAFEVAKECAAEMLNEFIDIQLEVPKNEMGAFWHNRTFNAAMNWFTRAYMVGSNIGFEAYFGSSVPYARPLENYSGSIQYMVGKYSQIFLARIEMLYGGMLQ